MRLFSREPKAPVFTKNQLDDAVNQAVENIRLTANASKDWASFRGALANINGFGSSNVQHDIYADFGWPISLSFADFFQMYSRLGIAKNVVELMPETVWMSAPTVESKNEQFNKDLKIIVEKLNLWQRLKGQDVRQRVGRYAGIFMRVRDNTAPDQPIAMKMGGVGALVQMVPLYESQLEVLTTVTDIKADDYGQPSMYQFSSAAKGSRNDDLAGTFNIHPSRIVIAAEGADDGSIYGIPVLESPYNSLLDIEKILGSGGEGLYKNAAQSVIFGSGADTKGAIDPKTIETLSAQYDDWSRNRSRRGFVALGLDVKALESTLMSPKEFFFNSLYDISAATKIPATILIGQQTGRLASSEDSKHFLSMAKSRQENFNTEQVQTTIDWFIKWGLLPAAEYTVEWDDLLALSDEIKLGNAEKMAKINGAQVTSGGEIPFTGGEIREAAGFDAEPEEDVGGEDVDDEPEDKEE